MCLVANDDGSDLTVEGHTITVAGDLQAAAAQTNQRRLQLLQHFV